MLEVLYEDNHLIAVNKKSGDIIQGDRTGDITLGEQVADFLKNKYNKPGKAFIGVVHRIDRPVTGVVVFAKTSKALSRMNKLFKTKEIQKTYWAISEKTPLKPEGYLAHYLKKNPKNNKTTAFSSAKEGAKFSELNYEVIGKKANTLIAIQPLTGRPHQIRVQLSAINSPILGDVKYGANQPNSDASICLHAKKIEFIHPVSKEKVSISAPIPKNKYWESIKPLINH